MQKVLLYRADLPPGRESHTFSEISQMGLECIGAVGAAEQAEVVRLALESLASLEVPTVLEVSHMGFVTALLDTLHVDAAARPRLLELLRDKNAHELYAAALQSELRWSRRQRADHYFKPARPLWHHAGRRPQPVPVRSSAGCPAGTAEPAE